MKHLLLTSTALMGVGLMAASAVADDGIKLSVGGFFKEAYMVVFDDDSEGDLGNERNTDGFFNDAEVHFKGSTVLDNGLEVGARIELEGETDGDQVDEAWIYFSGGFGEVRIGSEDEALVGSCIAPPGGTGNFSAFSPNQWGANTFTTGAGFAFTSNSICSGVDDRGDAQKIVYITPNFAGFQLSASYTPNGGDERHAPADVGGPHGGMPANADEESRHNVSLYGTYSYSGDGWGLTAGAGASFEGHVEQSAGADRKETQVYQGGLNLTFGNFGVGGVIAYYDDADNNGAASVSGFRNDILVLGAGVSYSMDAFTIGAQYSHRDDDIEISGAPDIEDTQDRIVLTGNYALGAGINVDAEIGYTWIDSDPELADGQDDYDALEIGIGTYITF